MNGPEFLIPIFFFMAVAAVFIIHISTRHRERMSMVEKGLNSEDIKALYTREMRRDPLSSLKWGILLVLAGTAVLLGNFLHVHYGVEEGAIIGLVCLAVGIGLVLFYSIASKKLNQ